jgi:hypothetical protein
VYFWAQKIQKKLLKMQVWFKKIRKMLLMIYTGNKEKKK